jgi:hypothetical protein
VELGKSILKGEKISQISLKGKTYTFSYPKDEWLSVARKSGWSEEMTLLGKSVTLEDLAESYVTSQSDFISDFKSDFCLVSGGFGCIDGKTKITTPGGDIAIEDLYNEGIAPNVYSSVNGKVQTAKATVPVKYEKAQLYKVRYGDKEVIATAKHRFLTPTGWKQLSDLSVGDTLQGYVPSLQESISGNVQSTLLSGGFHLMRRLLGFPLGYRHESHSYGVPPQWVTSTSPSVSQLPVDAHGHTLQSYTGGGHSSSEVYTHAYRLSDHSSRSDCAPSSLSPLASALAGHTSTRLFEHSSASVQSSLQSLVNTSKGLYRVLINWCSTLLNSSYTPLYHTVTSITPYKVDNYYDLHVFGTNNYLAEGVFHHNSGKSLALYVKMILLCKCFPGNRVLLGRKTLSDIDRAVLPELFDLMPPTWYEHRVKDGLINFTNGSQIILFGLDAMQSGGIADIKKAQQKLKSLNLGAYFIDQLEEVEYDVFEVLNSRLRRNDVPFRQGNMNCNPANFWAYHLFKKRQKWNGEGWTDDPKNTSTLYETSMLYNPHLPWDYIRKQISMGDDYVKRFVLGEWTTDVLIKGSVFAKEHIQYLETLERTPVSVEEGCEIYEQPIGMMEYRMGVDSSEGVVDPSSISVVSSDGKKVAKFNGKVPITALADKVKFLYYKYHKPLIVPESNAAGTALIREIRDLNVYRRKQLEYKFDVETEKLGFRTSWESKSQLITHFQRLLRNRQVRIYDKKTIDEMKSFMWSNEATQQGAGAARGFHDDDIMSTLLAYWEFNPERIIEVRAAQARPVMRKRFQYS